jgi:hypothetical protein
MEKVVDCLNLFVTHVSRLAWSYMYCRVSYVLYFIGNCGNEGREYPRFR